MQLSASKLASIEIQRKTLKTLSQNLETTFLKEMLSHANMSETPEMFGGGAGESQFASFLLHEQSKVIVKSGGIGLSEIIFNSFAKRELKGNE